MFRILDQARAGFVIVQQGGQPLMLVQVGLAHFGPAADRYEATI